MIFLNIIIIERRCFDVLMCDVQYYNVLFMCLLFSSFGEEEKLITPLSQHRTTSSLQKRALHVEESTFNLTSYSIQYTRYTVYQGLIE